MCNLMDEQLREAGDDLEAAKSAKVRAEVAECELAGTRASEEESRQELTQVQTILVGAYAPSR